MMNVVLENLNGWRYSSPAPHKTGAGIATPMFTKAHNRASAVFLRAKHNHIRIMVGRAGQPQGWPGSLVTGCCNPVRLTTHEIATSRGELIKFTKEDATMATALTLSHPEVTIENGRAVTTSVAVAEYFRKMHKDVLKKIDNLDCSAEFNERNFAPVDYTDAKGEKRPAYQITKNGFVFLVMGFTGKKAAAFKEAYIAEFDRMENELRQQNLRPVCNDIIHGDGRTLVIRFDEHGNIKDSQSIPNNACICTVENFKFFLEQKGWTLINRSEIKNMTVEQLLSLK
ncbi:transcriptional regulator [Salmonella enterica]|uniref:Rha family phage regulatory protein n=1 Tax=Salmonella enterica TaxID=28901 RepID=UPI000BE420ED|nr:Rha family phage regulatory protein [Salmonella enterica]ATI89548.1 transcriptional regulator [Salmonella enterica subsp. enterica]ECH8185351.1 transcriptional regulator [Salmonella enterica subsp. enterica serovar Rissen]EEJ6875245.1 transcriptional regulator [Salmonella enterica subsp. houtenae]EGF6409279.1 transcriptional regulator [Salmonella enterica subsp. enterica serovar 6,8:d:-]EHF3500063.1 transcriptional regulator [Salmonella enterica subsp. enterica serovar 6,8,20:d-]